MDTGRIRSTTPPRVGLALLGAAILALFALSATRERLGAEAEARAQVSQLIAAVQGGRRLDEALAALRQPGPLRGPLLQASVAALTTALAADTHLDAAQELLPAVPPSAHPALRAAIARAEARRLWPEAWRSPADLRRVLARYEAAPRAGSQARFAAQRSALRAALGRPDPEAADWETRTPPAAGLDPQAWLAQPRGLWEALAAWRLLRDGDGEAAYRRFGRGPAALRLEHALAGFSVAEPGRPRQTWVNRALKCAMSSVTALPPNTVWRLNRARAQHQGAPAGGAPEAYDALSQLLVASDLLASDPVAAARRAAEVQSLPVGGFPLLALPTPAGPRLVALPLGARLIEARAWAAAGDLAASESALAEAREWASCDPRPLVGWFPELAE